MSEPPQRRLPDRGRPTALIVIDVQNDYCHPLGRFAAAGLVVTDLDRLRAAVNAHVAAARAAGAPVVWVTMVYDDVADIGLLRESSPVDLSLALRRGEWGSQLLDGLDVAPTDPVVPKQRFSAFFATDLDEFLRSQGIERLVVCGVRTDVCVESTVRDAFMRDYEVLLSSTASASYFPQLHAASLRALGVLFAETSDRGVEVLNAATNQPRR